MKPVNRYTTSEFHDWVREFAPRDICAQDIDAFTLAISDDDLPTCLIEVKRSRIRVEEWEPFDADRNNYAAMLALANAAGIPFWIIYHQMGERLTNASLVKWIWLTDARPEYRGRMMVVPLGGVLQRIGAIRRSRERDRAAA